MATDQIRESLTAFPGIRRVTATRGQLQAVLLAGSDMMLNGRLWNIKSKHIGAGVYEMWLELRHGD